MNKICIVLSLAVAVSLTVLLPSLAAAASQPAQTGQISCSDPAGTPIPCATTGQDGDINAGVAWPGSRFINNGDGTITDALTGLMWLQNATTSGAMNWQGALDFVKTQNALVTPLLNHNDWRLPNTLELTSLANRDAATPGNWLTSAGFTTVPLTQFFWTSTTTIATPASAATIDFDTGLTTTRAKDGSGYAWLVRGPVVTATAALPQTGQTICYTAAGATIACTGTGQDGNLLKGQPWPSPRFTPNNQLMLDNVSGLTWTKDVKFMKDFSPGFDTDGVTDDSAITWQHALDFIANLNALTYLGFQDWRLPNISELTTLAPPKDTTTPADWLTAATFTNVPTNADFVWSSTSYAKDPSQSLTITLADGAMHNTPKGTMKQNPNDPLEAGGFVWPVRGGFYGNPILTFSPTTIDFGSVVMGGTSTARTLIIRNTTTAFQNLIVNSLTITGTDSTLFTVTPGGTNPCPSLTPSIAPGTNCSLDISFTPTTIGSKNANISLTTNAVATPMVIPLLGTAVDGVPPVGTISIVGNSSGNTANANVTLTLAATDNSGSVTDMRFSNDGISWANWVAFSTSYTPWTLTPNDGFKTVYAQFRDAAGNISNTIFATIVLRSSTPGDVTISGLPGNGFTNATTLVLTVNGTDTAYYSYTLSGPVGAAAITPAQAPATPSINTQIVLTNLPDGLYSIQVTGQDIAGNQQGTPTLVSWRVDRTPPFPFTITAGSAPSPTNNATPTLTGTIELGVKTIAVYVGSTLQGYASISGTTWTYTFSSLNPGTNTISVIATDDATNSAALQQIIVYDTQPPTATISGTPANGSTVNSSSMILTVDGTDVVAYKYKLDGNAFSAEIPVATPIRNTTALADGVHTVSVIGRDLAGNWQVQAAATLHSWRIDTVQPLFTLQAPTSPTNVTSQNIVVTGISKIGSTFTAKNETSGFIASLVSSSASLTFTAFPLVANASNVITVSTTDAAGNTISTSMIIVVDTLSPVATIAGVISNGGISTVNNAIFTIGGTSVSRYDYKLDKTSPAPAVVGTYVTAVDVATPISLTTLADGVYTLSVLARDPASNVQPAASPTTISWTVDSTAPVVDNTVVTGGPSINTNATSASFIVNTSTGVVAYKYAVDNGTYSTEQQVNTPINLSTLADGPHSLFVIGRDANGNWQKIPYKYDWTVQTTQPALTIDPMPLRTNKTTLTGTVQKNSTVSISLLNTGTGATTTGTATVAAAGTWSYTLPSAANATISYQATVTATSLASTINSQSINFTFDNKAPTVTITPIATASNAPYPAIAMPSFSTTAFAPAATVGIGASSAAFSINATNDPLATYTYRILKGATVVVDSTTLNASQPLSVSGLTTAAPTVLPDVYTVEVTAIDTAGNTSAISRGYWAVDTGTLITAVIEPSTIPAYKSSTASANIVIRNDNLVSEYKYQLYKYDPVQNTTPPHLVAVTYCSPPTVTTNCVDVTPAENTQTVIANHIVINAMPDGAYVMEVYGLVPNTWQIYPTTIAWTVDTTAPTGVTISGLPATLATKVTSNLILTASGTDLTHYRYTITAAPAGYAVALDPGSPTPNIFTIGTPITCTPIPCTPITFTTLPVGAYSFSISGRDSYGNWQAAPTIVNFTVDTTPPSVTINDTLSPTNPLITPTNAISQTIHGTVSDANATVTISANTTAVGGTATVIGNNWSFDLKGLVKGVNIITATATDQAGNSNNTSTTITLSTDLPLAVISSAPAAITNQPTAAMTVGGTGVVNYKYSLDSPSSYGSVTPISTPIALTALDACPTAPGVCAHVLHVLGQDIAGNWQETPTDLYWTVDTDPPTAAILTITPASPPSPTNARSASFTIGGTDIVSYSYELDGGTRQAETKVAVPISLSNLGNGSHTITVYGKDQAGNAQVTPSSVTWIVQTTAPTLTVTGTDMESPITAASLAPSGTVTPAANVTIASVTVTNAANSTTLAATLSPVLNPSSWSLASLPLAPGPNLITVTATDTAGNTSSKSFSVTSSVNPPTALILNGAPSAFTNAREASMSIGGTDVINYSFDLQGPVTASGTNIPVSQKLYLSGLSDGTYTLAVTGCDSANFIAGVGFGNCQSLANATTISWTVDTTPPAIVMNKVVSPTRLSTQKITGTAEPGSTVTVRTSPNAGGGTANTAGGAWDFTISGMASGTNIITATATDDAGNSATVSSVIEYDTVPATAVINGTPPTLTQDKTATISITGSLVVAYSYSLDGGAFSKDFRVDEPIILTGLGDGQHTLLVIGKKESGLAQPVPTSAQWTVDTVPPTATISGVPSGQTKQTSATLTIGGTGVVAYRYSFNSGPLSAEQPVATTIVLSSLAEGSQRISVIGRDQVGNWQTTPTIANWAIDTTPPSLTLNPVIERTINTSQTLSGTLEPGATLALDVDTVATIGTINILGNNWRVLFTNLALGQNNIAITATDPAGNKSVVTTMITVYVTPFTTLTGVPTVPVNTVDFSFRVFGQGIVAYKYSLDGGAYTTEFGINTPLVLNNLAEGAHSLMVVGRDISNIWQTPPTQATWTIDLTPPPGVTVAGMPASPTNRTSASLTIGGADVATYKYSLDSGAYSAFTATSTPLNLVNLTDGLHRLDIIGQDAAGNIQTSPTTMTWTVDTIAPVTTATPGGGVYNASVLVRLLPSETATIYYTIDGTTPSLLSTTYTVPITISAETILKYFAIDPAGNQESVKTQAYSFSANGDVNGDGKIDIQDAITCMRYFLGIIPLSSTELTRADIAPLKFGKPSPDGKVDSGDVLAILKIVIGVLKF